MKPKATKITPTIVLFNEKTSDSADYDKMLFEQYKLYVELADRISQRRSIANSFFITANAALLAITSWFSNDINHHIYFIAVIGIILALSWYFIIGSYRQLNSGKFKLIHELEQRLPLNLFSYEWEMLDKGESKKTYWPLSHVESVVPLLFIAVYIVLVIFTLCS